MAAGSDLNTGPAPFVLTLEMDGESFARLDDLRRCYTPPERNLVPAHVTLFHRLPGEHAREIKALLAEVAKSEKPMEIAVGEVKAMERGVAVFLQSPQLSALRDALAAEWWPWLSDQDQAGFRPHVTLQNNVSPGEASRTKASAAAELRLKRIRGVGLHLWRYREGRWESERLFRFR
jgi:2'-5' RNA ligase